MATPSPVDLARWRALVHHARLQADRPRRDARELRRAARDCRNRVLPFGGTTPADHLFCDLKRKAEAVAEQPASSRTAAAAELLRLATVCDRLLGGGDPTPGEDGQAPALRYRADIDG